MISRFPTVYLVNLRFPELYDGVVRLGEGGDFPTIGNEVLHNAGAWRDDDRAVQVGVEFITETKAVRLDML